MPRRGTRAQPQPQGGNTSGKKPAPYPAWTRAAMASGDWAKYSSAGVRAPSIWLIAPVVMGMGLEGSNSTRRWPDNSSRERLSRPARGWPSGSKHTMGARRIAQVLHERPDLADPQRPVTQVENGSIDFDHVSFSYKHGTGDQVLQDVDLHIRSGETIGVIGGTGSGKSTFANLISRLYDVDTGTVKVGGVDVRRYDMEALRNQVAVVLQKNVLFSGTILDNLRWGKEDATLEECQAACQAACADEFINRFPEGYNTWIEQGGTNVSGGQKQRLCIARALLKRPKVLILDDSTSAVDTATDSKIRQAFASSIPGTTKIIIAQRVSSVQDADRILVLDNGRVNGFGTHQQLLENNKIYQEIYQAQTQGGGDFDQAQGE